MTTWPIITMARGTTENIMGEAVTLVMATAIHDIGSLVEMFTDAADRYYVMVTATDAGRVWAITRYPATSHDAAWDSYAKYCR